MTAPFPRPLYNDGLTVEQQWEEFRKGNDKYRCSCGAARINGGCSNLATAMIELDGYFLKMRDAVLDNRYINLIDLEDGGGI